jgi:hypothetical protein
MHRARREGVGPIAARRGAATAGLLRAAGITLTLLVAATAAPAVSLAAGPNVLLVGPAGTAGAQYTSIQAAVNAAAPGDWVLVAPGVYHEKGSADAGVLITKPNIHLRGMDRNGVIVDGTNVAAGNAAPTTLAAGSPHCSPLPAVQDFGPIDAGTGKPGGRNGIEVKGTNGTTKFTADGVSIDNLTVCNYLSSDAGSQGNEVWWNGGDGSGEIGMGALSGSYLNATTTYYKSDSAGQGKYGIFTSNEKGPGVIDNTYSSNFGDSDYYIGACPDCNVILSHAHAEYGALGYSGTNGSGHLQILDGEWDNNKAGIGPNTLNNDDAPPPQTGFCASPPAGQPGCFVIKGNYVHDNNNPNVPQAGIAAVAPVGTGILLSGTKLDFVTGNRLVNNNAWGVIANDYPDQGPPPPVAHCTGGIGGIGGACYFVSENNLVSGNLFTNNGSYGQQGNGDLGNVSTATPPNTNCFQNNVDTSGPVPNDPGCNPSTTSALTTAQLICDSGAIISCVPVDTYPPKDGKCTAPAVWQGGDPQASPPVGACMLPLAAQTTMPHPCGGVPVNAFCPAAVTAAASQPVDQGSPNTGRGGLPPAALLVILALLVAAFAWRPRRRPSS